MIRARTTVGQEHITALYNYQTSRAEYKNNRKSLLSTVIFFAVIFLLSVFNLENGGILASAAAAITGTFAVVMLAAFLKSLKKPKVPDETMVYDIKFDDDSFGFRVDREFVRSERFIRYESLHKAVEWQGWFIVYLNDKEICIMKKTDLTEGSPEDLSVFLKTKLGTRFATE